MRKSLRLLAPAALLSCGFLLQGCVAAAAGAGAAGGYEAQKHGYGVQSPVKKDSAGGYKGQNPVTHDQSKDESEQDNRRDNENVDTRQ